MRGSGFAAFFFLASVLALAALASVLALAALASVLALAALASAAALAALASAAALARATVTNLPFHRTYSPPRGPSYTTASRPASLTCFAVRRGRGAAAALAPPSWAVGAGAGGASRSAIDLPRTASTMTAMCSMARTAGATFRCDSAFRSLTASGSSANGTSMRRRQPLRTGPTSAPPNGGSWNCCWTGRAPSAGLLGGFSAFLNVSSSSILMSSRASS